MRPGPSRSTEAGSSRSGSLAGTASERSSRSKPDEPVVAVVRRYDALADDAPSPSDLANLPYAHVESAAALRPFTLLAQTTTPYPGSSLSDRGLSSSGSLLVDNGAPNYDIVAGESPYALIPAFYEQSAVLRDATNAFAYGDQAAGGFSNSTRSSPARVRRLRRSAARRSHVPRLDPMLRRLRSERLAMTKSRVSAAIS